MPFSIAMIGSGQFSGSFAHLFDLHPGVSKVYAVDALPERADDLVARYGLAGTIASFEEAIASPEIDAVAILTQRWTHGPSWCGPCGPASTSTPPSRWRSAPRRSRPSSRPSGRPGSPT